MGKADYISVINTLPLGIADFRTIRRENRVYVDKTNIIAEIGSYSAPVFLSRPNRFGKSTLISTFNELFGNGLINFEGLKISKQKLWKDKTYLVLNLDFTHLKGEPEHFLEKLVNYIEFRLKDLGITPAPEINDPVARFREALYKVEDRALVLLIDEYDAPFRQCAADEQTLNKLKDDAGAFNAVIKGLSHKFRFIFFTGISDFWDMASFSSLNNIVDISRGPRYGTLLGYTAEELEHCFSAEFDQAARLLNIYHGGNLYNKSSLLEKMKQRLKSYCFDKLGITKVYNPCSVLNFLQNPEVFEDTSTE
ncbi:MAG: AAA family ATPase [Proteobacteria bacterium]|uniref:AAA family ATPase n=1 Tax=Candidatus Avisuccinivibrio stercorigallinarum TaxID=2840704 RepID=A0A9D9DE07_9GAMM|nr:AAA family ATPase [Candidatus Avisuccinivibrio stercorigallinarum]